MTDALTGPADTASPLVLAAAWLLASITQPTSEELPAAVTPPDVDPTEWVEEIYEARR